MRKRLALASVVLLAAVVAAVLWSDRSVARSKARAAPAREDATAPRVAEGSAAPVDAERAGAARLFGRVVAAETEAPVAGAAVTAYAFATGRTLRATSAADGTFDFPDATAAGHAIHLVARHEGFGAASVAAVAPWDAIVVRLPSAGAIRGRVVADDAHGAPVSPCRVSASRPPLLGQMWDQLLPAELAIDATAVTLGDGTFEMAGLAPGEYVLIAEPGGAGPFAPGSLTGVLVRAHEVTDAEISLARAAEILVDVFDEETGKPLDRAVFEMEAVAGCPVHAPLVACAQGLGTYGLQAGSSRDLFEMGRVRVSRLGYATRTVWFCHTDPVEFLRPLRTGDRFRVALGRGATLAGRVRASGALVQGASVLVTPAWQQRAIGAAATGADGAFEIRGIDVGEKLDVLVYGRSREPIATVGLMLANGERRVVEIGAPGTAAIEGRVVIGGAAKAAALVCISGASDARATTGPDGAYRFEALASGMHDLVVSLNDAFIRRTVEIAEGERLRLDIDGACTVSGVVIDSVTAEPVTDARHLWVVARGSASEDRASVREGGRFLLQVDAGVYRIDSLSEHVYAVEPPVVDMREATDREVVLRVSWNVRGCITLDVRDGRTGASVTDCAYEHAFGAYQTRKFGESSPVAIPKLPPGPHRLRVWSDAHAPTEIEVLLDDGQQEVRQTVELRRAEGVRITEVERDSEAARAGLRAGDTILACNGVATPSIAAFHAALSVGKGTARIEVDRNGEQRVATVPTEDLCLDLENTLLGR